MDALAGPYAAAAALLVLAGALEVYRPDATVGALRSLGIPARRRLVQLGAFVGAVVGAGALVAAGPTLVRVLASSVAFAYLGFAAFVAAALARNTPLASCGCFGRDDTPPSATHLVLDLLAAAAAVVVAVEPGGGVPGAVRAQPGLGIPFLLLTAVCGYLAYVAFTVLPRTLARTRRAS